MFLFRSEWKEVTHATLLPVMVLEQKARLERLVEVRTEGDGVIRKTYKVIFTVEAEGIAEDVITVWS